MPSMLETATIDLNASLHGAPSELGTLRSPSTLPMVQLKKRPPVPYSSRIPSNRYLDRNTKHWNVKDERRVKNMSILEDLIMDRGHRKANQSMDSPNRCLELKFPYSSRHSEVVSMMTNFDKGWEQDERSPLHSTIDNY